MSLLKEQYLSNNPAFFQLLEVSYHSFDLNRCDEKTFYISVEFGYKGHKVICDFIYIIDHPDMYGAISINERYEPARLFIEQHLNHTLMYMDELRLAQDFSQSVSFKEHFQYFAKKYPKYIMRKTRLAPK